MNTYFQDLQESLQADLCLCKQKYKNRKEHLECCFSNSRKAWYLLQRWLGQHHFPTKEEKINFYKEVKPAFKAELYYYSLLYHAELFSPSEDPVELQKFWLRELTRLGKFINEYRGFYDYIKSGRTDKDAEYFMITHAFPDYMDLLPLMSIELPEHMHGRYDELVASLLALERYHEYIRKEVELMLSAESLQARDPQMP